MSVWRRRRNMLLSSVAFLTLSAIVHFMLGALGVVIRLPVAEKPQTQMAIQIREYRLIPTPKPTPAPSPPPIAPPHYRAQQLTRTHKEAQQAIVEMARSTAASTPFLSSPVGDAPRILPPSPAQQPTALQTPTPVETPVDASDMVVDATFRHQVRPDYPEIARLGDEEGTVIIFVTVGADGEPSEARIESSSGSLAIDQAALTAAKASTYRPPEVDGKPAIVTYRVIYTFTLS